MPLTIGILAADNIAVGLVENHQIVGSIRVYPEESRRRDVFEGMHAETIIDHIHQQIDAVGLGLAGIIKEGAVEESPNLPQIKGHNLGAMLTEALKSAGIDAPVT